MISFFLQIEAESNFDVCQLIMKDEGGVMEKVNHILYFDFSTTRKTRYILMLLFFTLGLYYAYFIGNLSIIPISILIWTSMTTGLPFQLRERYSLDYLMVTLPMNRKCIIKSRYLYALINGALGIALSEIIICILSGVFEIGFVMKEVYFALCIGVLLFNLIISIHLPLYFKLSKAPMIAVSPIIVYFLYTLGTQLYYLGILNLAINPIIDALWRFSGVTIVGTILLSAIMLSISYRITCKLYINKDL